MLGGIAFRDAQGVGEIQPNVRAVLNVDQMLASGGDGIDAASGDGHGSDASGESSFRIYVVGIQGDGGGLRSAHIQDFDLGCRKHWGDERNRKTQKRRHSCHGNFPADSTAQVRCAARMSGLPLRRWVTAGWALLRVVLGTDMSRRREELKETAEVGSIVWGQRG
jgi:hypothetical protein